jgi:DNA-binding NarL/FixJ family response regulator
MGLFREKQMVSDFDLGPLTSPPNIPPTRVFLVDDHPLTRLGLRAAIEQLDDLTVCGEAADADEALQAIARLLPDVAVVDLTLPTGSGLDLVRDIHHRFPRVAILVLSMREEDVFAERAKKAGAMGYVRKEDGIDMAIEAIHAVRRGELFFRHRPQNQQPAGSQPSTQASADNAGPGQSSADRSWAAALSDRELEILELVGQGWSSPDIARRLHVSNKTVEWHRENLKRKLALDSANDLLRFAIRWVAGQKI